MNFLFIRHYWKKLSEIGQDLDLSPPEQAKILLLNRIILVLFPFLLLLVILDLVDKDFSGVLMDLTFSVYAIFLLILQHYKYYRTARWMLSSISMLMMMGLIFLYGRELGGSFCFFLYMLFGLIFFDKAKDQIILISLNFGAFIISEVFLTYFDPPLADSLSPLTYPIIFSATAVSIILVTWKFLKENRNYATKSQELLKSVNEKNIAFKRQHNEIEHKNAELEQINRELEKFAYVASHDLKTPLRNINSFLSLIDRKLADTDDDELKEYINFASSSALQMYYLIEDILEYSRLDKKDIPYSSVDLNLILSKVKINLAEFIDQKVAVVSSDFLPTIYANESQLLLLFQNIIENGIKYNSDAHPFIEIKSQTIDNELIISIRDNGIGILKRHESQIFEMFSRLHSSDQYPGSGIGLAICKKIIKSYQGKISLHSEEGVGTIFYLHFPVSILEKSHVFSQ